MPVISGGVVGQPGQVLFQEITFTETSGSGVYTGSVTVPGGSYLVDVLVHGVAVWDNAGTVDMIVGDSQASTGDGDGIFIITSLKAAGDLVAGETIAAAGGASSAGGEVGADIANNDWSRRYLAGERTVTGVITTSSTGGSTGRTRMIVVYTDPISSPVPATKV